MRVVAAALVVLGVFGGASHAAAGPNRFATELRCSADEATARAALEDLERARDPELELPIRPAGTPHRAAAAEVDEALYELWALRVRFPSLAERAEAIVLGYHYCAIFDGEELWDVVTVDGVVKRVRPRVVWPRWRGFEAWGFLGSSRRAPALVDEGPLGHDQRGWYLGALATQRCFPHPVFGVDPSLRKIYPTVEAEPDDTPLIATEEGCRVPPPRPVLSGPPGRVVTRRRTEARPEPRRVSALVVSPGSAIGAAMTTTNEPGGLGFSGRFVLDAKLDGATSAGAGISYSPRQGYFARVGLAQTLGKGQEGTSYSWGIGYDDWHEGTFSAQLNDWGPRSFEARPSLASAAIDLGYKLPLSKMLGSRVSCGISLNFPFSAAPGTVATVGVKPFGDFFLLGGVRMSPFTATFATWFYGFGFSNYRPFTFGLSYANWGPNKAFVPNFERGSLVATFSWAL